MEVVRQWVGKLAERCAAEVPWDAPCQEAAILWSQKKGDRSGRIANQFANNYVGSLLLNKSGISRPSG
jgi:predicted AAA+ superfamily ATPase